MMIYPTVSKEVYPFADEKSVTVTGAETLLLSAGDKQQVLQTWQRFLLSGFELLWFDEALHRFMAEHCRFISARNRTEFWQANFTDLERLKATLAQFGGDRRSVEQGDHAWLRGPAADLKLAICEYTTRLYAPLLQVLHDLEAKYEEMVAAWHAFALASNITDTPLPPAYQVSQNTRHLLAYAAQIALKHQRPLTGLQLRFPLPLPESREVILIDEPTSLNARPVAR